MAASPLHTGCALRELPNSSDAIGVFERLRVDPYPWFLDSALPSESLGRFSFAGADPYLVLRAWGGRVELECRRAVYPGLAPGRLQVEGDALEIARGWLPQPPAGIETHLPFCGGAVGYLGYELAEKLDAPALHGHDDLGLPDVVLLFVDRLVAFDHVEGRAWVAALGFAGERGAAGRRAEAAADALDAALRRPHARAADRRASHGARAPTTDVEPAAYAKAVDAIKEEIAAGEVYQACLTHRMERVFAGDPWALYRRLRRLNPAPFACFFELPEVAIASSSPERFLRLGRDRLAESRPIKGTRRRGGDPAEDAALRRALATSEKDRAENLMIVDLVRNDLGRVCETGSVHVPELMHVEAYASLFQLVSTVRGKLRSDRDAFDLVRATFPPGSMTGAPKIAAMRILDRLESVRRGIYAGALGYFDARGGADLSVAIRALFVGEGRATLHAGGGIVADSDPADEYRESLDKARLLLEALDL